MLESVDLEAGRIERLLPILQALARSSNCSRSSRLCLKLRFFDFSRKLLTFSSALKELMKEVANSVATELELPSEEPGRFLEDETGVDSS